VATNAHGFQTLNLGRMMAVTMAMMATTATVQDRIKYRRERNLPAND
jgi:hypothetical protein